ncbi:YihA family ribosome biogenesis GTP-binding protein [Helicobacter muridarum]|uniref:Probable GTP-binding protein EngB n=1 Tax=Helicobacter muridarum TaxID=216 RepID=A0A377PVZ3_9HELI|nr:ribosome biogenesis GTP-binding protein YihA/YsxC [Helicobacter muridarum]TLE00885.1 YihA family ribosome biogenesis GTP-binding protein [Helicobacter muridarum]STQ86659.1 GTPase [Helicobacter muridarum]
MQYVADTSIFIDSNVMIRPLHSKFIKSASNILESIPSQYTEIAILGRSNVGKSSFINKILNAKLAKSSSTPGKTRLINFFQTTWEIRGTNTNSTLGYAYKLPLVIIDLPGFGYAKVDKKQRQQWDRNLTDFLQRRNSIKLFCHLIDSRHRDLNIDKQIRDFLDTISFGNACQVLEIYTKSDKLAKNELRKLRLEGKLECQSFKYDCKLLQGIYRSIVVKSLGMDILLAKC